MTYEFGAERDGTLVYAKAHTVLLDGGAYASSTAAVVGNAGTLGLGPYRIPNVAVDAYGVFTNNPPCGAMRGFGCVQAAFAYEALMDELADAVGLDRVAIRQLNGMREGDLNITGQVIDSAAPVAELLQIVRGPAAAARARRGLRPALPARARSATPRTARASSAASATRSPTRTSASPRASTTTRPRACGWR